MLVLGELDWTSWVGPSSCIVGGGMVQQLCLQALTPLALIVLMPVLGGCISSLALITGARSKGDIQKPSLLHAVWMGAIEWLPLSLVLSFCLTPSVCASIFKAWYCVEFDSSPTEVHSFLALDLSVRCDGSKEHRNIIAVAWVLVSPREGKREGDEGAMGVPTGGARSGWSNGGGWQGVEFS